MFESPLTVAEQRVLGCLMEKQLSTPDYYPLTLSALVNACNQSNNRDPVTAMDESSVSGALDGLRDQKVVWFVEAARARKYEHRIADVLGLSVQEMAILTELLLRGPQTPGELRSRCTRMYAFQDLQEVETVLAVMMEADPPLVTRLPRQPGTKEARFGHLLGGVPEMPSMLVPASRAPQLEAEVAALREDFSRLREEFEAFRKQFD